MSLMKASASRIARSVTWEMLPAPDRHREGLGAQAGAAARPARDLPHELLEPVARRVGVGLGVASLDVGDGALVGGPVRPLASVPVLVADVDTLVRAVQQDLARRLGQPPPRGVEVEVVRVGNRFEHAVPVLQRRGGPRRERPVVDRQIGVGHHELGVDLQAGAQSVAGLARAVRRVEREVPRGQLVEGQPAVRAREVLREGLHLLVALVGHDGDRGDPFGELERLLDGVGDAAADVRFGDEPVDHDLDRVLVGLGAGGSARRGHAPRRRSELADTPCAPGHPEACRTPPSAPGRSGRAPGTGCPPASAITWSTICSGVCRPIGRPQL